MSNTFSALTGKEAASSEQKLDIFLLNDNRAETREALEFSTDFGSVNEDDVYLLSKTVGISNSLANNALLRHRGSLEDAFIEELSLIPFNHQYLIDKVNEFLAFYNKELLNNDQFKKLFHLFKSITFIIRYAPENSTESNEKRPDENPELIDLGLDKTADSNNLHKEQDQTDRNPSLLSGIEILSSILEIAPNFRTVQPRLHFYWRRLQFLAYLEKGNFPGNYLISYNLLD